MGSVTEDTEDLITCSVCLMEYNEDQRKPKYLQCFHTICLQCLESIYAEGNIVCPLCRITSPCPRGAAHLISNTHALYIVGLRKRIVKRPSNSPVRQHSWCLTCSAIAKTTCSDSHYTTHIPSNKAMDGLDLQKELDECRKKVQATLGKRQEIKTKLQKVLGCLKAVEEGIKEQLDENNQRLIQLKANLKSLDRKSNHNETFNSLKNKIEKTMQETEDELRQLTQLLEDNETENRIRVQILLKTAEDQRIPACTQFEEGFYKSTDPESNLRTPYNLETFLLSHLIFSVLRRQNFQLKPPSEEETSKLEEEEAREDVEPASDDSPPPAPPPVVQVQPATPVKCPITQPVVERPTAALPHRRGRRTLRQVLK